MPHSYEKEEVIDSGLACFELIANYCGVPVNTGHIKHELGLGDAKLSTFNILQAAKLTGFKSSLSESEWERLSVIKLPVIAKLENDHFVVVAQANDEKVLVHDPIEKRPITILKEAFEQSWTKEIIHLSHKEAVNSDKKFDFSWFIPAIVKYRKILKEVIYASFFLQLFALLTPIFFQVIIDKVLIHKALTTLHVLAIGMGVMILFEIILGGLRTYLFTHTSNRIDVTLGSQLFNHLLKLPLSYFESRRVGGTVARVRELDSIRQFLTGTTVTLFIDTLFSVVFITVLFLYSPTLTWIVVGTIPFYVAISIFITPLLRKRLNDKFAKGAENQAFLVETISGIETVKSMAIEPTMQKKWDDQLAGYVKSGFKTSNLSNVAGQIASFVNKITTVLILWVGAFMVMGNDLTIGQLIAFNMLAGRVTGPLMRIVQVWQEFQEAGISMQKLADILNVKPENSYSKSKSTLPEIRGHVRFEHVKFRYNTESQLVLPDLSFDINPGETIGIVGRSGSGKSTITKLIQRLYIPEQGQIFIDNIDIAQIDPAWLRRQIGVVLQENYLFSRSVRENIALANPAIPFEQVTVAAQLSGAHKFIQELNNGYDTVLEERGMNLSGGQRQRIAIARALVTNPKLLIFDEATSALDYESESIIQQNMAKISQGRTVFIIAHRLSTVRNANRILVIDEGHIVEQGNHDELLALSGYYANLYQHQSGVIKPAVQTGVVVKSNV